MDSRNPNGSAQLKGVTVTSDVLLGLEKALRYRALPNLIGRKVVINGVADVEAQVKQALSPDIPESCRLDCNPVWMEGTIAKGILDLTFLAPHELLDSECASGLSLLQDLRLIYPVTKEYLWKGFGIGSGVLSLRRRSNCRVMSVMAILLRRATKPFLNRRRATRQ